MRTGYLTTRGAGVDGEDVHLHAGDYLLSRPYTREEDGRIPSDQVCEALSTPLRFLAVLLGRHPKFGRELGVPGLLRAGTITDLVSAQMTDLLEPR